MEIMCCLRCHVVFHEKMCDGNTMHAKSHVSTKRYCHSLLFFLSFKIFRNAIAR